MRWGTCVITVVLLAIVVMLASGCATDSKKKPGSAKAELAPTTLPVQHRYERARAGSLVFDPPVTQGQLPLRLAREDRNPDAFVGYDSVYTTYFYLRTDDRQHGGDIRNDRFDRRAVSTKVGATYR